MSQENVELVQRWFEFLARGELPLHLTAEDGGVTLLKPSRAFASN